RASRCRPSDGSPSASRSAWLSSFATGSWAGGWRSTRARRGRRRRCARGTRSRGGKARCCAPRKTTRRRCSSSGAGGRRRWTACSFPSTAATSWWGSSGGVTAASTARRGARRSSASFGTSARMPDRLRGGPHELRQGPSGGGCHPAGGLRALPLPRERSEEPLPLGVRSARARGLARGSGRALASADGMPGRGEAGGASLAGIVALPPGRGAPGRVHGRGGGTPGGGIARGRRGALPPLGGGEAAGGGIRAGNALPVPLRRRQRDRVAARARRTPRARRTRVVRGGGRAVRLRAEAGAAAVSASRAGGEPLGGAAEFAAGGDAAFARLHPSPPGGGGLDLRLAFRPARMGRGGGEKM